MVAPRSPRGIQRAAAYLAEEGPWDSWLSELLMRSAFPHALAFSSELSASGGSLCVLEHSSSFFKASQFVIVQLSSVSWCVPLVG